MEDCLRPKSKVLLCGCRFAVTPLTEDCGLIEWVPHTGSLREAITSLYIAEGLYDTRNTIPQIRRIYEKHIETFKV